MLLHFFYCAAIKLKSCWEKYLLTSCEFCSNLCPAKKILVASFTNNQCWLFERRKSMSTFTLADIGNKPVSDVRVRNALLGENLGSPTLKFCMSMKEFIDCSKVYNVETVQRERMLSEEQTGTDNISSNTPLGISDQKVAQRSITPSHSKKLATYILCGLVRSQVNSLKAEGGEIPTYVKKIFDTLGDPAHVALQPVVVNIRDVTAQDIGLEEIKNERNKPTGVYEVSLSSKTVFSVVDGQHRRNAFSLICDFIEYVTDPHNLTYQKNSVYVPENGSQKISYSERNFWESIGDIAMRSSTIAVECHIGLSMIQEKQMFSDLNSKGLKAKASYTRHFDSNDQINVFVINEILDNENAPFKIHQSDQVNWDDEEGLFSMKDICGISSWYALGKSSSGGATPAQVKDKIESMRKFWEAIYEIKGLGNPGHRKITVAAQPVVLKTLASLSNYLLFNKNKSEQDHEGYKRLLLHIKSNELDFSHQNPVWRALHLNKEEREKNFPGLNKYVMFNTGTFEDFGWIDTENDHVRFSAKTNSIIPKLADVLRWKLGLKPRALITKKLLTGELTAPN